MLVGSYDANVYCFDVDGGQPLWTYQTDNYVNGCPRSPDARRCSAAVTPRCTSSILSRRADRQGRARRGLPVAGSVAMLGDRAYFGHYGNEFLRVDLDAGEVEWRYAGKRQAVRRPRSTNATSSSGARPAPALRAAATARRCGKFRTKRKVDASPVICGDKVVFGSGDGRLYMLRIADGAKVWSYDVGKPIYSSPAVVDGKIVVGAGDKRVYAFSAPVEGR